MLNKIRSILGPEYFYQTIWSAIIKSPRHRLAALNFLAFDLPIAIGKSGNVELANRTVFGSHQSLVSQALALSIEDKSSLVARSALDVMASYLVADNR